MRVAIDAHAIGRHLTGNEVYVRSLIQALGGMDPESEFLAYVTSRNAETAIPQCFESRQVSANPFVRLGIHLSHSLRRDRADLLHVQYTSPIACPVPVVVSVHDVSFLEHPEYFPRHRCMQLRLTVARTVRQAARVIAGSEFARDSILRAYGLPENRIVVIPHAASPSFRPVNHASAVRKVQQRFPIRAPFILSVGDLQPRKNHIGLIKAFTKLVQLHPHLKHQLVLAGKDTWYGGRVREAAQNSGIRDRIVFTGFVSDDDLLQLYNACECFAFPSLYEGFGIPVLEAMACGRAVIASHAASIPEVADGAGILFNPYSTEEIVRALADVLLNAELRARLERLGLQRAAFFSWQRTAEATLEVYRQVAGAKRVEKAKATHEHSR